MNGLLNSIITLHIRETQAYTLSVAECPTLANSPSISNPAIRNNVTNLDLFTLLPDTSDVYHLHTDMELHRALLAGVHCPIMYAEKWVYVFKAFQQCQQFIFFARWILYILTEPALSIMSNSHPPYGKYTTVSNFRHLIRREITQWLFQHCVRLKIPDWTGTDAWDGFFGSCQANNANARNGYGYVERNFVHNMPYGDARQPNNKHHLPTMTQILLFNPNFSLRGLLSTPEFELERIILEECILREYDFCSHYDIRRILSIPLSLPEIPPQIPPPTADHGDLDNGDDELKNAKKYRD